MKARMIKGDEFHSFRHLPLPTPLKILGDTDFSYQAHTTQLNPFILWHQNVEKPQAIASGFSEPRRKPDKFGSKLEQGCPQPKCWALETSHPTCQAGQLGQPGWKQLSSSRVWSPFGRQWSQWLWPKEGVPGLAESPALTRAPTQASVSLLLPRACLMSSNDSCSQ